MKVELKYLQLVTYRFRLNFYNKKPFRFGRVDFHFGRASLQPIFLNFPIKRSKADAKQTGSFSFVALRVLQHSLDVLFLNLS